MPSKAYDIMLMQKCYDLLYSRYGKYPSFFNTMIDNEKTNTHLPSVVQHLTNRSIELHFLMPMLCISIVYARDREWRNEVLLWFSTTCDINDIEKTIVFRFLNMLSHSNELKDLSITDEM